MKLLDPMAGIRLASGHPYFHLAQFIASWIALRIGKNEASAPHEIQVAFMMLQWGHFANFMLRMVASYAKIKSKMPHFNPNTIENYDPNSS